MVSNVIFQVEFKTPDSRELNQTCEEACYRKVPVIKDISFLSLFPNTHRKMLPDHSEIPYIFFNDIKISFTKKLTTKVQLLLFMMGPCELQW